MLSSNSSIRHVWCRFFLSASQAETEAELVTPVKAEGVELVQHPHAVAQARARLEVEEALLLLRGLEHRLPLAARPRGSGRRRPPGHGELRVEARLEMTRDTPSSEKLWRTRSRLYRRRCLQPNIDFSVFFEIYKIYLLRTAPNSKCFQNVVQIFWEIS